jgi:hypothetical protein
MSTFKNITGLRFGRLVAFERVGRTQNRQVLWLCQCDCGKTKVVVSGDLLSGHTKSCDCLSRELTAARNAARNPVGRTKHGQTNTPTYRIWSAMHARCRNPKHKSYKNYGGRGVTVEDLHWAEFAPFRTDMGEKPPGCDIHRKDNDKGYSKENCVWLSRSEHARLHASLRPPKAPFLRLPSGASRS